MAHNSFTQKVLMMIVAGFAAACLLYVYRHIVQQAFYESNEGWKESLYHGKPARSR